MTPFVALFLTIPISFAASTILAMITVRSLRTTLKETSENHQSIAYWIPYSVAALYLLPLFVGLLFGVGMVPNQGIDPAAGMTRIFASVLGGCLLVLGGIGTQLSKHNQRWLRQRLAEAAQRGHYRG